MQRWADTLASVPHFRHIDQNLYCYYSVARDTTRCYQFDCFNDTKPRPSAGRLAGWLSPKLCGVSEQKFQFWGSFPVPQPAGNAQKKSDFRVRLTSFSRGWSYKFGSAFICIKYIFIDTLRVLWVGSESGFLHAHSCMEVILHTIQLSHLGDSQISQEKIEKTKTIRQYRHCWEFQIPAASGK